MAQYLVLLIVFLTVCVRQTPPIQAEIVRWTITTMPDGTSVAGPGTQVIPGTEGIDPGPGVQLDQFALNQAWLATLDLRDSSFVEADLTNAWLWSSNLTRVNFSDAVIIGARFGGTTSLGFTEEQLYSTSSYKAGRLQGIHLTENDLTGWDLAGKNLGNAWFEDSALANTDFSFSSVRRASFKNTTANGFTAEQLYSTSSYLGRNLVGINLSDNDLAGWDFSRQNLKFAPISNSILSNADFSGADLTSAILADSVLDNAEFSGAVIRRTNLARTVSLGFTKEHFYSTLSYQQKSLDGVGLRSNDISGWNFEDHTLTLSDFTGALATDVVYRNADLTLANFSASTLANADFGDAVVIGANFSETTSRGFTPEQLYSTASYQAKNLVGIDLSSNVLTGWDLSDQALERARISNSEMTDTNLTGALITGVDFRDSIERGLKKEQIYSTASYQQRDLRGVWFNSDLTDWDFSGQNLANSGLGLLNGTQLSGANLSNVRIEAIEDAQFSNETIYNQWTDFPEDFDPVAAGLRFLPSELGDFDANSVVEASDVDLLIDRMSGPTGRPWLDGIYDLNSDNRVDDRDLRVWVKDIKNTYFGDVNLDGQFDTSDLVEVFSFGEFNDDEPRNSTWRTGDWDGDKNFTSGDLVIAFSDGGFGLGPRSSTAIGVPEPHSALLLVAGLLGIRPYRRGKSLCDDNAKV